MWVKGHGLLGLGLWGKGVVDRMIETGDREASVLVGCTELLAALEQAF